MGCDKAKLPYGGRPLWRRQWETLEKTGPGQLRISGPVEGPWMGSGVPVISDREPGLGPLAGIAAGLEQIEGSWLLVLGIDLPQMEASFLAELIQAAEATGRGVVPQNAQWFEPLAAVYPGASLGLLHQHLAGTDRSVQAFIRAAIGEGLLSARPVADSEQRLFRNLNTPDDLPVQVL